MEFIQQERTNMWTPGAIVNLVKVASVASFLYCAITTVIFQCYLEILNSTIGASSYLCDIAPWELLMVVVSEGISSMVALWTTSIGPVLLSNTAVHLDFLFLGAFTADCRPVIGSISRRCTEKSLKGAIDLQPTEYSKKSISWRFDCLILFTASFK